MEEIDEDLRQLRHVLNDAGLLRYGMLPHLVELACKVDARERDEARAEVARLRCVLTEFSLGLSRDDMLATTTRDDVERWVMTTARAALEPRE